MRWDIFCEVIDNFGDAGVCWRLASQLAGRGQPVRLWIDDARALQWMAPGGCAGVQVLDAAALDARYEPADVVICAFGCALPSPALAAITHAGAARPAPPVWINLEYLSAEDFARRAHGLPSPVHGGAVAGVHKWFYYPGFTAATGGLLREADLCERQRRFDRAAWLAQRGISWSGEAVLSLFCYEPPALGSLLEALAAGAPAQLLVTFGRAAAAVRAAMAALPLSWNGAQALRVTFLPQLSQHEFDQLLWASDCNFVRGEDSLVRALWAGAPMAWQAYPQDDGVHRVKVAAFLDWLQAPASMRRFHAAWNGFDSLPVMAPDLVAWRASVQEARARLLEQEDLVTRLLRFAGAKAAKIAG